jgi:DNA-binding FadR family transcriptional regulator
MLQIQEAILKGEFNSEDQLPSERKLQELFGISKEP